MSRLPSSPGSYWTPLSAGPLGCCSIRWSLPGSPAVGRAGQPGGPEPGLPGALASGVVQSQGSLAGTQPCRLLPNRPSWTGCILRYYNFRWLIVLSHDYFITGINFFFNEHIFVSKIIACFTTVKPSINCIHQLCGPSK